MSQAPTVTGDWRKERLPRGVYERLFATLKEIPQDPSDQMTLGECKEILQMRNNWALVELTFIHPRGFRNKEHFMIALDYVIEHRNAVKHGKPPKPEYSSIRVRDEYFQKLMACISTSLESPHATTRQKRPPSNA
jgi:hypothetical protein